MKVWIITSQFGQGHYSAAKSLEEELTEQGHEVVVSDIITLMYPTLSQGIYHVFNHIICRHAMLYNFINEFGRNPKNQQHQRPSTVDQALKAIAPDLIITTWSACARILGHCSVPVYICITDIGVHTGWIATHAQGYLVATKEVKKKLLDLGVSAEKIHIHGIPVKKVFKKSYHKANTSKRLLIMGGGLGILPWIEQALEELSLYSNVNITVIAGKNKKLYNKISKKYPSVTVVGFTPHVYLYLREADLLVSKPGGVSLFESIYTETPCITVFPEYKHEIENAQFISTCNIGETIWQGQPVGSHIIRLLENEHQLKQYQFNMSKIKQEIEFEEKSKLWDGYHYAL